VPLVQLLDDPDVKPGDVLAAGGDATNHSGAPTSFVADAHKAGLVVHPYTFRNENQFLPVEDQRGPDPSAYGNAFAEDQRFFAAGVDGIFTDNPDTGVAARNEGGF
jgi:glycerophosphoryl diester phosphodiesterase